MKKGSMKKALSPRRRKQTWKLVLLFNHRATTCTLAKRYQNESDARIDGRRYHDSDKHILAFTTMRA